MRQAPLPSTPKPMHAMTPLQFPATAIMSSRNASPAADFNQNFQFNPPTKRAAFDQTPQISPGRVPRVSSITPAYSPRPQTSKISPPLPTVLTNACRACGQGYRITDPVSDLHICQVCFDFAGSYTPQSPEEVYVERLLRALDWEGLEEVGLRSYMSDFPSIRIGRRKITAPSTTAGVQKTPPSDNGVRRAPLRVDWSSARSQIPWSLDGGDVSGGLLAGRSHEAVEEFRMDYIGDPPKMAGGGA